MFIVTKYYYHDMDFQYFENVHAFDTFEKAQEFCRNAFSAFTSADGFRVQESTIDGSCWKISRFFKKSECVLFVSKIEFN